MYLNLDHPVPIQTGEGWNKGIAPKAIGAQNLDIASRALPNLQHFVMFSSLVASVGNEGLQFLGPCCHLSAEHGPASLLLEIPSMRAAAD